MFSTIFHCKNQSTRYFHTLAWSLLRFRVVGASLPKFNVFLVFIVNVHLHFGWTHKEACFATPLTPFIFFFYLTMLKRYIRTLLCPSFSPLLWLYLCGILCVGLRSYLCGQPYIVRGAHNQKVLVSKDCMLRRSCQSWRVLKNNHWSRRARDN